MRPVALGIAAALGAVFACAGACSASSNDAGGNVAADGAPEAEADAGLDAAAVDARPAPNNPYGVPYPTEHIGRTVRLGLTPGDVIGNLTFMGYPPGVTAPSFVQMATFFDPAGRTHDLVAIVLSARWDRYSADLLVTGLAPPLPARVALLSVLGDGQYPETPATLVDLTDWRTKRPEIWNVFDPSWSQFDKPPALPRVIELDARTMEIVSLFEGDNPDIKAQLEADAVKVTKRAPSY